MKFGKRVIVNHTFRFKGPGKLIIGDGASLWSHEEPNRFFTYAHGAIITVGERSRLNGLTVHCRLEVSIGNDCRIGSAIIMDNDFHSIHFGKRNDPSAIRASPVHIKDRAWLAGQCAILKGVTVGEEAVVGFRAVVTKDVPPKTVVAGNPARVVKEI